MERWTPIRCRIPELLKKFGKTQRWLAGQLEISEQSLSDYVHMRKGVIGTVMSKNISELLKCERIDDLYEWKRSGIGEE